MRNKEEREKLEGLLAQIHADTNAAGSEGEICISPLLGATVDDPETGWASEGEDDELFS